MCYNNGCGMQNYCGNGCGGFGGCGYNSWLWIILLIIIIFGFSCC